MEVIVLPSIWIGITYDGVNLQGIQEGVDETMKFEVHNYGNTASGVDLEYEGLEGWTIHLEPDFVEELGPGENIEVEVSLRPRNSADDGLKQIIIYANSTSTEGKFSVTDSSISIDVSKAKSSNKDGIAGIFDTLGLPAWTIAIVFFVALVGAVSFGIRARKEFQPLGAEQELIPRGSALQAGTKDERRAAALDTSTTGDVVTGEVSKSDIQEALDSSAPTLPMHQVPEGALPLPLTGLPDGWTMDQWVAYGHLWWEQNGP